MTAAAPKLNSFSTRMSRRSAMKAAAGGAASAILGAAAGRASARQTSQNQIELPTTGAKLPTEDVTFRILAQGPGPRSPFFEAFVSAYQEAHPNITIQYEELPASELQRAVPLAIQNSTAPDIIQLPPQVTNGQAVQEGWVVALNDIIPSFDEWKQGFPDGTFVGGITEFAGEVFTFPLTSNKRYSTLSLFNEAYLQDAGYDPSSTPLTWGTYREALKKVTEQGQGQYYGAIIGASSVGNLESFVSNLAAMAGAAGGVMDWRTGTYNFTSEHFLAVTELLLSIQSDGSFLPGFMNLLEPEAIAQMPQGVAGMILQGPWAIPRWKENAPDFSFGVGSQPHPDEGPILPLHHSPGGANHYWVSKDCKYPEIAGDMFAYIGSLEGQAAYSALTDGSIPPIISEAALDRDNDPQTQKALDLFDDQMRMSPDPRVRNPAAGAVQLELKPITPSFGEILQGVLTGQLSDPAAALQDLQDRSTAELERAIEATREKGVEVSLDDWVFPNWDPNVDYTQDMYDEL